ncbi:MAG: hypothetical protein LBK67_05085, partial [Coriobacteriales bacterium]|nr:hypothetical protein [Coriobacteriales bacterium]
MAKAKTDTSGRMLGATAERLGQNTILVVSILLALMLAAALAFTIYNSNRLGAILEESVKSELLAVCFAARSDIDIDLFMSINSEAD